MQSWVLHKIECPLLKRIYPRNVPDAARMLCKLIIKLDKGGDLVRGYYTETCSRRFRDMMSRMFRVFCCMQNIPINTLFFTHDTDYAEIKNDERRLEHLESLYGVLQEMMGDSVIVPNLTELTSLYGRV